MSGPPQDDEYVVSTGMLLLALAVAFILGWTFGGVTRGMLDLRGPSPIMRTLR